MAKESKKAGKPRDGTPDSFVTEEVSNSTAKPDKKNVRRQAEYYRRSEREYGGREREKTGGRSHGDAPGYKESVFKEDKVTFMDDSLKKAKDKKDTADIKLQRAKANATRKKYSMEKVFDEKTGSYTYKVVETTEALKLDKHKRSKDMARRFAGESAKEARDGFVGETDDNAATDAVQGAERSVDGLYDFVVMHSKSPAQRKLDKVKKAEQKKFQMDANYEYKKWLSENPQLQEKTIKNEAQKQWQKKQIQRKYAKAAKGAKNGEKAAEIAAEATKKSAIIAKKTAEIIVKNSKVILIMVAVIVLLLIIMSLFVSCGAMFTDTTTTTLSSSYFSEPAEIDAAALQMTELEMNLQKTIDNIEIDNPDYDEYDYNLGEIGHDPNILIAYLSAKHTEFTATEVESEIQGLFDAMYELTLTPDEETRTRTVTKTGTRTVTDPETGEEYEEEYEYEEEEEYTVTILRVSLTVKPLEEIATENLTAEQQALFAAYMETKGLLQVFASPVDYYWYNYVSSYYGYRINPITGLEEFHRGIDIAVPEGTTVYATHVGTIAEAGYDERFGNYVVISDSNGYTTKYGHLQVINVSVGQSVRKGTVLGKSGNTGASTGSHLHLECLYNGEYYNPLFYFNAGTRTMYGENSGGSGAGTDLPLPESYDDAQVAALIAEADKYVGMEYVWGGSNPSTGFDCSGFVCWVYKNSGTYPLERTTAQGIYNKCAYVSPDEAQPGDIIFFTGTYSSAGPVSHVGIYCGNGVMVHCGDPIKYASINTSYWQSHFYAFGRLAE